MLGIMNGRVVDIECAKDHAGSHELQHVVKGMSFFGECQGCGEFYTWSEVNAAVRHDAMLARGVRELPPKSRKSAKRARVATVTA